MILPRFWAKAETEAESPSGKRLPLAIWRWSERSANDARLQAEAAVEVMASRIRRGDPFPDRYTYGDRPVREKIVRTHTADDGSVLVAVTRNVYGALVMNTAHIMFLDIDFPVPTHATPVTNWLKRKLTAKDPPSPAQLMEPALARLQEWLTQHPNWSVRVYRTRAGLRYLITHSVFEPHGREAQEAMTFLGTDERYRALCRVQQSFRARLTPKPWRIRIALPPAQFPYDGEREESKMAQWEMRYAAASQKFAVCELVTTVGRAEVHPEVEPVRAVHDEVTGVGSGLPLA